MKFICPSCKAKYQIADDKVAGRSVRMKCRKCGYVITIAKTVTEGSASRRLEGLASTSPPADAAQASQHTPPPAPVRPAQPAGKAPAPRPGAPPARTGWKEPGAVGKPAAPNPAGRTMVGIGGVQRPPPSRQPPSRPLGREAPPRPGSATAPPRPAAGSPPPRPTIQRPGRTEPIGSSDIGALLKPGRTEPVGARMPGAEPYESPSSHRGGNGAGRSNGSSYDTSFEDEDRTMIAGLGALADVFSEKVAGPDSSALVASLASTDEWYVGINGVPVGPIRLSELRSKASTGAITIESLVWREGFEQWLPLSNFPELVAIVEEGLSSAYTAPAPIVSPYSAPAPPAGPHPEVYDPFRLPGEVAGVLPDPFAPGSHRPTSPSAGVGITGITPTGGSLPSASASPFGPIAVNPTGGPMVIIDKGFDQIAIPQRRNTGVFAWIAVGVALLLGLTIGFVMFSRKQAEPIVKYVEVPAKSGEVAPAPSASSQEITIEVAAPDGGVMRVARSGVPKSGEKVEDKPLSGLSGLSGLQGNGPTSGPSGGSNTSGSSNQALDSGQIQQTVGKYTGSVKRSCWQPALDSRSKDAPTSARVSVSITVGPSGSVQNVSTSGDPKGYPGLASCIGSRVKAWQFPASNGTTTVNVPFVFAAQ